jgi:hypothetical protein
MTTPNLPLSLVLSAGSNRIEVDFSGFDGRPVTAPQRERLTATLREMCEALNARLATEARDHE